MQTPLNSSAPGQQPHQAARKLSLSSRKQKSPSPGRTLPGNMRISFRRSPTPFVALQPRFANWFSTSQTHQRRRHRPWQCSFKRHNRIHRREWPDRLHRHLFRQSWMRLRDRWRRLLAIRLRNGSTGLPGSKNRGAGRACSRKRAARARPRARERRKERARRNGEQHWPDHQET